MDLELAKVHDRLVEKQVQLEVSDEAKDHLVADGYDPVYAPARCAGWFRTRWKMHLAKVY